MNLAALEIRAGHSRRTPFFFHFASLVKSPEFSPSVSSASFFYVCCHTCVRGTSHGFFLLCVGCHVCVCCVILFLCELDDEGRARPCHLSRFLAGQPYSEAWRSRTLRSG